MTREEAIADIRDNIKPVVGGKSLDMAIKALEQENILDKIKAEIEQSYCKVENDYDQGRNYGLFMAMQIIDKYKAESEDKE